LVIDSLRVLVRRLLDGRGAPVVIALDGPSGAGKSTIAAGLAAVMPATVVPSDDFFSFEITAAQWSERTPEERALAAVDCSRLRQLVLEPLRAGHPATWYAFGGVRADGSYEPSLDAFRRDPAPVIILEGAYSTQPALADLIDCAIFVETPAPIRRARLAAREEPAILEAWHRRWDAAEAHYFANVRPVPSFDIVVETDAGVVRELRAIGSRPALLANERSS
jgi:uridine kinase